jgi:squalene-hopene/tetraprenyl-beta-curcumene cyclase
MSSQRERAITVAWMLFASQLFITARVSAQSVGPNMEDLQKARQKAVNFLKTSQLKEGGWSTTKSPGISALATYALLINDVSPTDPVIEKALKHLESFVQPDGGVYAPKGHQGNYETSLALLSFQAAKQEDRYQKLVQQANHYLRGLQLDESEQVDRSDVRYGGAGYGRTGDRPDLSNTAFFLDALKAAGVGPDDPAFQKALVFVSRCQNLESENNTTAFAAKINDGGFFYTPAAGGSSPAGTEDNGGLRSYASMTYAGLKSMLYAGVTPEDKRVQAALAWIKKHYSVTENPGLGKQGMFYYYHLFAKALAALDLDYVEDQSGQSHDWRKELSEQLFAQQKENGSWLNENDRWFEGNPDLGTAFALMSLHYCEPKKTAAK